MKKLSVCLLGATAVLASSAVFAADSSVDNNSAAGFYVSGAVGYGLNTVSKDGVNQLNSMPGVTATLKRNGIAYDFNVGYQFDKYLAVEGGYLGMPRAKLSANADTIFGRETDVATLSEHAFTLDVKGIYPFNDQFSVFAKAGVAFVKQKAKEVATLNDETETATGSHDATAPLFGLGVSYNINQNVAVTVQGITTLKSGSSLPATYEGLVGLTYKF